MEGEFLVAPKSTNQTLSDSVVQGTPLVSEQPEAPGMALNGAEKEGTELDAELAAALAAAAEEGKKAPATAGKTRPTSPLHSDQWYFLHKDRKRGPVTAEEVKVLLRSGKLSGSALAWHEKMQGWRPLEELSEFADELRRDEEPATAIAGASLTQQVRSFGDKFGNVLWLFFIALATLVLACFSKEPLVALGRSSFILANVILATLMLCGCGYGLSLLGRNWQLVPRLSHGVRVRGFIGLCGLLLCSLVTFFLASTWRGEGAALHDQQAIMQAKRIFGTLLAGNVEESYGVVHWKKLRLKGKDLGARFQEAQREEQRKQVVQEVFNEFLVAFEPYYEESDMKLTSLKSWRIEGRQPGRTTVSVQIPSTGRTLVFTIQAGLLVALDVR
jgi:hypothetical protein